MNTESTRKTRQAGPPIGLFLVLFGVFALFAAAWYLLQPKPALTIDDAIVALESGDIETAHAIISAEYELNPQDPALQRLLAATENVRGNTQRALELLKGLPQFNNDPELQFQAAQCELQNRELSRAESCLRRAIELDPSNVASHRLLVELFSNLLRTVEARKHIRQLDRLGAISVADTLTACIGDRARFDLLENIEQLEQVIRNEPNNGFALHALANNFLAADRSDAANRLLKNHPAETVQPIWRFHLAAAELQIANGEFSKALSTLQSTETNADELSRAWLAWGRALRGVNRLDEAATCFRNAAKLDRFDPEPVFLLSQILQNSNSQEASDYVARTRKLQATNVLIESVLTRESFSEVAERIPDIIGHFIELDALRPALLSCRWMKQNGYRFAALDQHSKYIDEHAEQIAETLFFSEDIQELESRFNASSPLKEFTTPPETGNIRFTTNKTGIDFSYKMDESDGLRVLTALGGGVGAFDYDADGLVDLFFPQGGPLPHLDRSQAQRDGLFRKTPTKGFQSSSRNGLPAAGDFGHGVSVADIDNDGFDDLLVTRFGRNSLFLNNGDGTFADHSSSLGSSSAWSTSAAFSDLNRDGQVDVYITNYLDVDSNEMLTYSDEADTPEGPTTLPGATDQLLINSNALAFSELSQESSVASHSKKNGLGVVISDFNNDGRPDIFVGNDQTPNLLFVLQNASEGTKYAEQATRLGTAYGGDGRAEGCMGIACGDINGDALPELFVTNFAKETNTLYLNTQEGGFIDNTKQAGLERMSYSPMGWGAQFADLDGDLALDLIMASGHLHQERMKPFVLQGDHRGAFSNVSDTAGEFFQTPHNGRGLAVVDLNNDAVPDLVFTERKGSPTLLINETTVRNPFCVRLIGRDSNRSAIGARLTVEVGDKKVTRELTGGSGYLSENQRQIFLAAADHKAIDSLTIRWPSGRTDHLNDIEIPSSKRLVIVESSNSSASRVNSVP